MHQRFTMQLGTMPLNITFLSTGQIAIQNPVKFSTIYSYDGDSDKPAYVSVECIWLWDEEIAKYVEVEYNVALDWKDNKPLLKWLQSNNMIMPTRDEIERNTVTYL